MSAALVYGDLSANTSAAFFTWIYKPTNRLTTSVGLRTEYFDLNRHWFLSPRISANWRLTEDLALKASWGYFYQTLPLFLLTGNTENLQNADPRAEHAILGFRYSLPRGITLSVDLFNKAYSRLPLAVEDASRFVLDSGLDFGFFRSYNQLLDEGTAFSRGIEIFIQKNVMEKFYGLFSFSYFRSRFKDFHGVWRNRINDNQYLLTLVAGYRPKTHWNLNLRVNLSGGIPYTPYDLELSQALNRGILDTNRVFQERYPAFLNVNLRVERRFRMRSSFVDLYLGVINLLNRKNIDKYYWDMIGNTIGVIYQTPLLPVFGVTWSF